jgi:hypothetical protein
MVPTSTCARILICCALGVAIGFLARPSCTSMTVGAILLPGGAGQADQHRQHKQLGPHHGVGHARARAAEPALNLTPQLRSARQALPASARGAARRHDAAYRPSKPCLGRTAHSRTLCERRPAADSAVYSHPPVLTPTNFLHRGQSARCLPSSRRTVRTASVWARSPRWHPISLLSPNTALRAPKQLLPSGDLGTPGV